MAKMKPKAVLALAKRMATARVSVARCNAGPETGFAVRFRPKLAGKYVGTPGMPKSGYRTYKQALKASAAFRQLCRDFLARHTVKSVSP